jgi:hypothetical protein
MSVGNGHVREFAAAHRLRTFVREDGEVALRIGPRKPQSARICGTGRVFYSDHHASYGLRPGVWTIFVGPMTRRALGAVVTRWRELGLSPHDLNFEAWVDVPQRDLLRVLAAHPRTRPHRRRVLTPEQAAVAAEFLAKYRRGDVSADSPTAATTAPVPPVAVVRSTSESSGSVPTSDGVEPPVLGGVPEVRP